MHVFTRHLSETRAVSYLVFFSSCTVLVIYALMFSSNACSSVPPSLLEGQGFKSTVVIPPRYDSTVAESLEQ